MTNLVDLVAKASTSPAAVEPQRCTLSICKGRDGLLSDILACKQHAMQPVLIQWSSIARHDLHGHNSNDHACTRTTSAQRLRHTAGTTCSAWTPNPLMACVDQDGLKLQLPDAETEMPESAGKQLASPLMAALCSRHLAQTLSRQAMSKCKGIIDGLIIGSIFSLMMLGVGTEASGDSSSPQAASC